MEKHTMRLISSTKDGFDNILATIDDNLLTDEDLKTLDNKLASETDFSDTFKISRHNTITGPGMTSQLQLQLFRKVIY